MKKIIIISVSIISILIALAIGVGLIGRSMLPLKYKSEIQKYAKEYNIEPELLAAVIQVRSNFNPKEYKEGEACGLMAIQGDSAKVIAQEMGLTGFKPEDLDDPETSIKMGAWFISENYKDNDFTNLVKKIGGISWQHAKPNTEEEEKKVFGENYYKEHFEKKIKNRAKLYKIAYPSL